VGQEPVLFGVFGVGVFLLLCVSLVDVGGVGLWGVFS
jgi:hypothetical protein